MSVALGSREDLRVLIAMENKQAAMGARAVFKEQKADTVQVAEDKQDALSKMHAVPFNLVLIEDVFSDLGGIDFSRFVRMVTTPTSVAPIILAMKIPDKEKVIQARDAGINKIIIMPFTGTSLMKTLADIMLNPRPFIRASGYTGPCRRIQVRPLKMPERRVYQEGALSIDKQQQLFKGLQEE